MDRPVSWAAALARSRLVVFLTSLGFTSAVLLCLSHYASQHWPEYGYSYAGLSAIDTILLLAGLMAWSLVVPTRMDRVSSVILFIVYFSVCIPGLVVPLGLERVADETYHGLVLVLIVSFAATCVIVQGLTPGSGVRERKCSMSVVYGLLILWALCLVLLVGTYRSVMTLVSLDAIYEQRAAGAATSRFMGYVQTYFGYVLSPALLAFGLVRRNFPLVAAGFIGGLVLYAITAEKNAFAFPYIITGFYLLLTHRNEFIKSTAFMLIVLGVVLGVAVTYSEDSLVAAFLAWYVGVRSLLTPGLFIAQYMDFFSDWGYTHLSHVTGLGHIVSAPAALQADDRWPSLGHLVGEQYVGSVGLNANANFVATDGIASFGLLGVPLSFLSLAAFLVVFDRAAQGIRVQFAMLVALPIGLVLTNVSLATVMLSFGGLFWLLVMALAFRSRSATRSEGGES